MQFDVANKSFTVRANREVIVSAGTVKTAQLLLLSGIGPKEELKKFHVSIEAIYKGKCELGLEYSITIHFFFVFVNLINGNCEYCSIMWR